MLGFSSFFVGFFPLYRFTFSSGFHSISFHNLFVNGVSYYYHIIGSQRVTLLQTLDYLRINIPRFCYHEALNIAGNCRMCLVSLSNSIKPVIACSTLLSPGMEVFTNSFVVRRYRKSILEFLLINHPLDCPICDQAGKCDLQDLAFVFGHDVSRFTFDKRVISNISFSPFVKTVMFRCIHCTRCIRFLSDVLFVEDLGMMGRGSGSIISTFVQKTLSNPLVGNVIDLCPVGALISKGSIGSYRSWEKESSYFIDILDPFLKPVSIELCGNRIVDILPVTSDLSSFISDSTRSLWDSLQSFRISQPFIYLDRGVFFTSSTAVMGRLFSNLYSRSVLSRHSSSFYSFLDLKDSFFFSFFFNSFLGISNSSDVFNSYNDFRNYFVDPSPSTISLIASIDIDQESPLFVPFFNRTS
jgi:NADH dehydrogenase/NADH:ubiquinone oxidoreductase subunit G